MDFDLNEHFVLLPCHDAMDSVVSARAGENSESDPRAPKAGEDKEQLPKYQLGLVSIIKYIMNEQPTITKIEEERNRGN